MGNLPEKLQENVQAVPGIGNADLYLLIETPRPAQRRVQGMGAIGGPKDQQLPFTAFLEASNSAKHYF